MGRVDDALAKQKCAKCENCGNMCIISKDCWGCRHTDKFIIPDYPAYHGQAICEGYKTVEGEVQNMNKYVGVKLVEAKSMNLYEFEMNVKGNDCFKENQEGYMVVYPDGYKSWSPKEVFENAYFRVGDDNSIKEYNVNEFIESYDATKWGDKTTIVNAKLTNGFIITEASSCVEPENFNMDIGYNICKERIRNQVWGYLGFMLQCAVSGVKRKDGK